MGSRLRWGRCLTWLEMVADQVMKGKEFKSGAIIIDAGGGVRMSIYI